MYAPKVDEIEVYPPVEDTKAIVPRQPARHAQKHSMTFPDAVYGFANTSVLSQETAKSITRILHSPKDRLYPEISRLSSATTYICILYKRSPYQSHLEHM